MVLVIFVRTVSFVALSHLLLLNAAQVLSFHILAHNPKQNAFLAQMVNTAIKFRCKTPLDHVLQATIVLLEAHRPHKSGVTRTPIVLQALLL